MRRVMLCVCVLLMTGCAGVYIPPCKVTGSAVSMPCVGYSNGKTGTTDEADILRHKQPYWPAVLFRDEQGAYSAMRVR